MTSEGKTHPQELDESNKQAPNMNPEKSGIRSGNPQLDPESARKEKDAPRGPRRDDRK